MLGRQAKHCYERKKTLRAEVIESEVERGLLRYLKELPAKTEKMQKQHIPEINSVNIEISKIDEQIAKALSDMEFVSGVAITILGDKINALDKKKQELKRELTRLTVISQKPIHGGFDIDDVIQEWSEMTIGQKKAVAKVFIKRVTITDDTLDIDFLSNVSSTYG